nr:Chain C, Peptide G11N [synthetic construct]
GLKEGIPALD